MEFNKEVLSREEGLQLVTFWEKEPFDLTPIWLDNKLVLNNFLNPVISYLMNRYNFIDNFKALVFSLLLGVSSLDKVQILKTIDRVEKHRRQLGLKTEHKNEV